MADLRTDIEALLLADLKAEAEAGFPTVRRIPSMTELTVSVIFSNKPTRMRIFSSSPIPLLTIFRNRYGWYPCSAGCCNGSSVKVGDRQEYGCANDTPALTRGAL